MLSYVIIIAIVAYMIISHKKYIQLNAEVLLSLGLPNWNVVSYYDETVTVKSRAALEKYDAVKFFKENHDKLDRAEKIVQQKAALDRKHHDANVNSLIDYANANKDSLIIHGSRDELETLRGAKLGC